MSLEFIQISPERQATSISLNQHTPDIQEAALFLPRVERGKDPVTERDLRAICAEAGWESQRVMWECVRDELVASSER